ncbi:hypothetical protein, partial [Burkholderia sp. BCC0322]|uniref:hypothetical protein n=1 Tax=Burkholderia sp. BCC0322 TaxID=2676296 RepID=UPI001ABB8046
PPACAETLELRHFNFAQMRHYNFALTPKLSIILIMSNHFGMHITFHARSPDPMGNQSLLPWQANIATSWIPQPDCDAVSGLTDSMHERTSEPGI